MLKELINQFYLDRVKNKKKRGDYFYITDAGKCPRQLYFQFKGVPKKELEPRILRIFDHGDYTHMRIMSILFALGIVRAAEIKIPAEEIISGRADAIIGFEGKPYVLDIKSIASFGFQKLNEPKDEHIKQLQLYLHYFKIPQGILLYENKDTQELKEFLIRYDPKLVQGLLEEFEALREQIKKDIIPMIPAKLGGWPRWPCQYCEYLDLCKRVEKSKLKKWDQALI